MKRDMVAFLVCIGLLSVSLMAGRMLERKETSAAAFSLMSDAGRTLVLDAGHGGEDGGALTSAGDRESDINLAIVLRLDQLMGLCGQPCVLTREGDYAIYDPGSDTLREKKVSDIHNRVALVESFERSILLSVHQNTYPDPRYSGAQVFYAGTPGSQLWAEQTQEALRMSLNENNQRKAKKIPDMVYLMSHVTCPAILVECGFLSSGEEAALLLTKSYQTKVAATLAGATLRYIQLIP